MDLEGGGHYEVAIINTECNSHIEGLRRGLVPDSLKPVLLKEIYQALRDRFNMISFICGIYKR